MTNEKSPFLNPYKPGAGHMPPHLAGRQKETDEFLKLASQITILENMVLTGLRGVGKTVLLDTLKPLVIKDNWLWVGTDLSESASVSEENIAIRLLTDLSIVTSNVVISQDKISKIGFVNTEEIIEKKLGFNFLVWLYQSTPGLVMDKLKNVLEFVWDCLQSQNIRGIIFAYDEAQNLSDQAAKEQYPLGILLDTFQSLQRKNVPFMLLLTGLPTLFPKLVESRTFAERMFRVVFLERLNESDSREAILKPIIIDDCPVKFTQDSVDLIVKHSGGYPYFIQFICKEAYDAFLPKLKPGGDASVSLSVPLIEITRKLDTDFFAGRWARATDRQRELLSIIAQLDNCEEEFSVQDIVELSKKNMEKPFSPSHVNQMLSSLSAVGIIYKNRFGKYSFAVPLLGQFILRQQKNNLTA